MPKALDNNSPIAASVPQPLLLEKRASCWGLQQVRPHISPCFVQSQQHLLGQQLAWLQPLLEPGFSGEVLLICSYWDLGLPRAMGWRAKAFLLFSHFLHRTEKQPGADPALPAPATWTSAEIKRVRYELRGGRLGAPQQLYSSSTSFTGRYS